MTDADKAPIISLTVLGLVRRGRQGELMTEESTITVKFLLGSYDVEHGRYGSEGPGYEEYRSWPSTSMTIQATTVGAAQIGAQVRIFFDQILIPYLGDLSYDSHGRPYVWAHMAWEEFPIVVAALERPSPTRLTVQCARDADVDDSRFISRFDLSTLPPDAPPPSARARWEERRRRLIGRTPETA